jgi:hypothetical protein
MIAAEALADADPAVMVAISAAIFAQPLGIEAARSPKT